MTDASGPTTAVEASLDVVVDGTIMGWARDPSRPDGAALIELRLGRRRIALVRADRFRPDLRDAGWGSGHHGFAIPVMADAWERARQTGEVFTASSPAEPARILFTIDEDERLAVPPALLPLVVEGLTADDPPMPIAPRNPPSVEPAYRALVVPDTAVAARNVPGLFPYGDHVRHLRGVEERFAPALIGPDLGRFLHWYITDYGVARAPRRAPLSAAVIRWLNEPATIGGQTFAASRALLWFMAESDEADGLGSLGDAGRYHELVYWWACERAPDLNVEDCLVSGLQIDTLRRVPEHRAGQSFPLSIFMEIAIARRPALSRLGSLHSLSARVTAYVVLALEALDEPGLLRFVPRRVLDRLFGGDAPLFDRLATGLVGGDAAARPLTTLLYRARLAERGFDFDALAFLSIDAQGHRCEAARLGATADAPTVDIQVIGPFGKASGVAQAARLSRAVLATTPLAVAATEFSLDNAQPDGGDATPAGASGVPARINLVHLNADMLPLAFAYLPDLHRDAYTVGFFFWELDRPARCHRLALDLVDEVWVASEYNRACFAAWTDKPVINVGAVLDLGPSPTQAAVRSARTRVCRAGAGDFVVLATFDSLSFLSRKNPLGLLRAFCDAFADGSDVRLVIKTHNTDAIGEGPARRVWDEVLRIASEDDRIVIIDETMTYAEVLALKAAADCYASLHRSEGLGFGMLEAMGLGVPVLCTAYSGNLDFCDDETAWLVAADEVGVAAGDYAYVSPGHRWAEPRHDAAVAALRAVRSDAALRATRAAAARERVLAQHSIAAAAKRYTARIDEIMATLPAVPQRRGTVDATAAAGPDAIDGRRRRVFGWPRGV